MITTDYSLGRSSSLSRSSGNVTPHTGEVKGSTVGRYRLPDPKHLSRRGSILACIAAGEKPFLDSIAVEAILINPLDEPATLIGRSRSALLTSWRQQVREIPSA